MLSNGSKNKKWWWNWDILFILFIFILFLLIVKFQHYFVNVWIYFNNVRHLAIFLQSNHFLLCMQEICFYVPIKPQTFLAMEGLFGASKTYTFWCHDNLFAFFGFFFFSKSSSTIVSQNEASWTCMDDAVLFWLKGSKAFTKRVDSWQLNGTNTIHTATETTWGPVKWKDKSIIANKDIGAKTLKTELHPRKPAVRGEWATHFAHKQCGWLSHDYIWSCTVSHVAIAVLRYDFTVFPLCLNLIVRLK